LTSTVLLAYNDPTMNGVATISQKGQVVIPQNIREFFGLKPFDRLYFEVKKNKIVAKPILSVEEALGMVKTPKLLSKKENKEVIKQKVRQKFS